MRTPRLVLAIFVAVLAAGCITTTTVERIPFPVAEYEALLKTGTGKVTGQAFLRTQGGDVITAAGSEVILNPVTSYSNQWYAAYQANVLNRLNTTILSEPDPRILRYFLQTTADASGQFEFNNVPPGDYYVTTSVTWFPTGRYSRIQQGGFISRRIQVSNEATTEVIISSR